MSVLRVGIIGLGMAVAPHAEALLALSGRIEVVAAFSPTASRRQEFADRYGLPVVDSLQAILSDASIDAVLILTPPSSHLELVEQAARAGKHILLEKPLDISTERAEAVIAATRHAGVKLGIVFQNRFRPASLALAELLSQGRLGDLISASARRDNWRTQSYYDEPGRGTLQRDGGGVLMNQAIHTLDLLLSFAGTPLEVTGYARTSPIHTMETEDLAACVLRFANGAIGTISATTCAYPGLPERIELIGTKGTAVLIGPHLSAQFRDGTSLTVGDPDAGRLADAQIMGFGHQLHEALLSDFAEAIAQDRSPRITGEMALRAHDLIDAILLSSREGRAVTVRDRA